MQSAVILSTLGYEQLAGDIARLLVEPPGQEGTRFGQMVHREQFPDGETYLRIDRSVQNQHVVIVGATRTAEDLLEIASLAWQAVRDGAAKLSLVIPYFGYSTMERAVRSGEVVRAKVNATLLSSLPNPPGGKTIFLLDLHAEGIQHYFEGNANVVHLYAKDAILAQVRQLLQGSAQSLVVGSADTGRAKWVESYANELGAEIAVITKRRHDGERTEILQVGGANVTGKTVLLYDDMIRSGGSIIKAAKAYRQAGAAKIIIACTHLVLTKSGAPQTLAQVVQCADALVTTDSVGRLDTLTKCSEAEGKLYCVTVAPLLAAAVKAGGRVDEKYL